MKVKTSANIILLFLATIFLCSCGYKYDGEKFTLASLIQRIFSADASVSASHKILIDSFSKLDSIDEPVRYVAFLKTDVTRSIRSEITHCERAREEVSSMKNLVVNSDLDEDTKKDLLPVLYSISAAYSSRSASLSKTLASIDSIKDVTSHLSRKAINNITSSFKSSQNEEEGAASLLASFCLKYDIKPEQK